MTSIKVALYYLPFMLLTSTPASAFAQSAPFGQAPDMQMHKLFSAERKAHVGEQLPNGIMVFNSKNKQIDLRKSMKGSTILFRINPDCPPCDEILALLSNPESLANTNGIHVVVLSTDDDGSRNIDLPTSVMVLHTPGKMRGKGFLDGHATPTTFYFDNTLKLVKRKVGVTYPIQALLRFPAQP